MTSFMQQNMPTAEELAAHQKGVRRAILRQKINDEVADVPSLLGKTANALSAALNIHMQVYQRLAAAQSLADVRAAVEPALPLMQRVGAMLAAGELRSVQHAQGVSDEDAVIEGLLAMTQAAAVIEAQAQEKNDAN
jgi:hypothetical protein